MKARNKFSAFAKVVGSLLALSLLWVGSTSFQNLSPTDGIIEQPFSLDNFAKETVELTILQPGEIAVTAEWAPKKAELALILFGPGQMNYYRRSDGKSPLELKYKVTETDTSEGAAWRIKLVNQSGETVEGLLQVSYPVAEKAEETNILQ